MKKATNKIVTPYAQAKPGVVPSVMNSPTYDGAELRRNPHRPGSGDAAKLPSRIGKHLAFPKQ